MYQPMNEIRLRRENQVFAGTGGVSRGNRRLGFRPAFWDSDSGEVRPARFGDGSPAPMHVLDGLPPEWVTDRLPSGRVVAVKPSVVAGFVRGGRFYTRAQAAAMARG